jgi:hypothetical protein
VKLGNIICRREGSVHDLSLQGGITKNNRPSYASSCLMMRATRDEYLSHRCSALVFLSAGIGGVAADLFCGDALICNGCASASREMRKLFFV